jgi:hypothetical protein
LETIKIDPHTEMKEEKETLRDILTSPGKTVQKLPYFSSDRTLATLLSHKQTGIIEMKHKDIS